MVDITFYGGVSEIGGNKILINEKDSKIFLDFGISFAKEAEYFDFPLLRPACKEDLFKLNIIPKIKGIYNNQGFCAEYKPDGEFMVLGESEEKNLDAVFLSHAHMDHYGYFGLLRPDIPIYMSEISKKFIELREHTNKKSWNSSVNHLDLKILEKDQEISIGDLIIKRFDVDHSVLGASSYIIKSNDQTICYTGDFRFHGHRGGLTEEFLSELKNQHIDVLITEGTRVSKPKEEDEKEMETKLLNSEKDVLNQCVDIVSNEDKLIIYDASPADLDRVRTVWKVAQATGRKLIIDSRKAYLLLYINAEKQFVGDLPQLDDFLIYLNRLKFRSGSVYNNFCDGIDIFAESFEYYREIHEAELTIKQQINSKLKKTKSLDEYQEHYNNPYLFEIEDNSFIWGPLGREKVLNAPNEFILYTSNGIQTLLQFKPENKEINGTYIYGKAEPFNEEMELSFNKLKKWLIICGLKLDYAHTSGHVSREHMENFLEEITPKKLIPIHTENPKEFFEIGEGKVQEILMPSYGKKFHF